MTTSLVAVQLLNGVEYGLLLFLVASGLTIIFGVLGVLNFAHGSFYMLGAYLAYFIAERTGSLLFAALLGLPVMVLVGFLVERLAISRLYARDHLSQVLLTYGLVLVFNDLQRALFGNEVHGVPMPRALTGSVALGEMQSWPVYRIFTSVACLCIALLLRQVILGTRFGMRVRAGASNAEMVEALGIDVRKLFSALFTAGAVLAALSGMLAAPLTTVYPGMGEGILIVSFVVVVIGGIGSIKGAFAGALLVGIADTFGKVLLPGVSSAVVYAVMAAVLLFNELQRALFGNEVHGVATPRPLAFGLPLAKLQSWPAYRAFTCVSCLFVAAAIRHVLLRTRFGMRVRAGAVNSEMVEALGIDVRRLLSILFSAGTALAALAGILAAPLTTVYPGMGEGVLIVSFVVVVIGGIGSVKGAFFGALLVGLSDTLGKVLLPGLSSAIVYAVMAAVLLWRPRGLFGQPAEAR